jgi:hypothetical protein
VQPSVQSKVEFRGGGDLPHPSHRLQVGEYRCLRARRIGFLRAFRRSSRYERSRRPGEELYVCLSVLLAVLDRFTLTLSRPTLRPARAAFFLTLPGCCTPTLPVCSVYDAFNDRKVSDLHDGDVTCIFPPYDVEAAFCQAPRTVPVQLKLAYANCTAIKRQYEVDAPFFLWGNKGANVLPNTRPLPDGGYYLYTKVDGVTSRIRFTQCCDCCNDFGCPAAPFPKACSLTI